MKKFLVILLTLVMLSSPARAATEKLAEYYTPPLMNEGQYPIPGENLTLKYWMPINAGAANFITTYDENPSYQAVQQNTGVDIEFMHPSSGSAAQAFQTLLLADELPDMIQMSVASSFYTGGLQAMYEDGLIVDVAPYLDEFAPQYKEVINHTEDAQRQIIHDGKVFGFYKITYADPMPYVRFNINKTWLDEFGMKEPKLISEYEEYFQKVLDNKPGVTPLFLNTGSGEQMALLLGAYDMLQGFYLDPDGETVRHYANMPQYKEFLTLLHSWYEKGYLSKDFASMKIEEAQSLFDNQQLACYADSVDATYNRAQVHGNFELSNCPYARFTEDQVLGNNLAAWPVDTANEWVTVITKDCKNVEAAVQYLNYGYTFEGSLYFTFGIEGLHWNWGEDGVPKFTDEILHNPLGMTISNVSYALKIHFGSRYCYPDSIGHPGTASNVDALRIRTMWKDDPNEQNFLRLPPLSLTSEEAADRNDIMSEVDTYISEMKLRFITGAEPLDNFDQYIETINGLGLPEALEITQAALDRYLGK